MGGVAGNLFFLLVSLAVLFASAKPVLASGNGDFEFPGLTPPNYFFYGPIPGWTRLGSDGDGWAGRVGYSDSGGSVIRAGHGNQFAMLGGGQPNGVPTPGSVSISTNVTGLTPGNMYTLSFMIAFEGEYPPNPQSVTATFSVPRFFPSPSTPQHSH